MLNPYRNFIEMKDYKEGMEDGWETLTGISKKDLQYVKGLAKKYICKEYLGISFKFAYKDTPEGRFWIKFKFD